MKHIKHLKFKAGNYIWCSVALNYFYHLDKSSGKHKILRNVEDVCTKDKVFFQ